MILIPAIDLIDGKCVRLTEGDFNKKVIYGKDPIEMALQFKSMGAKRIHIVDLDGAKTGYSINRQIIKKIKKETNLVIQTGGGIRTEDDVKDLLFEGIDFLILGTILVKRLDMVEKWLTHYGEYFLAGVDVKNRIVQSKGWTSDEGIDDITFGKKLFQAGFKTAIYTDISKDGRLEGPNIEDAKDFTSNTGLRVILSGGIGCEDDIKLAKTISYFGTTGVIIGKAIYENKINLKDAITKYQDLTNV